MHCDIVGFLVSLIGCLCISIFVVSIDSSWANVCLNSISCLMCILCVVIFLCKQSRLKKAFYEVLQSCRGQCNHLFTNRLQAVAVSLPIVNRSCIVCSNKLWHCQKTYCLNFRQKALTSWKGILGLFIGNATECVEATVSRSRRTSCKLKWMPAAPVIFAASKRDRAMVLKAYRRMNSYN